MNDEGALARRPRQKHEPIREYQSARRGGCCDICKRPLDHDHDPYYVETDPGHYDGDVYFVATRNHLYVEACWSCWFAWPDEHKTWPELGFGRDVGDVPRETA